MSSKPHILVVDPAVKSPELDCFNNLVRLSPLPLTYHLPALFGFRSLAGETLEDVKGIVVLGSASSVNERLEWQQTLEAWLKPKMENGIPTLGICYGHQMIAHMFGGKIEYHSEGQCKHLGFREVRLKANPLWQNQTIAGQLYVSHNEWVPQVPPGFEIIAESDQIKVDGLAHSRLPIWTFQPHPEAIPSFMEKRELKPTKDGKLFSFGHDLVKRFLEFASKK